MTYSYAYTTAARVAAYSEDITSSEIPDVIAEDGEDLVDQWLLAHGINPSGLTDTYNHLRNAATFFICYLLQKAGLITTRGSDITSESAGGASVSYVSPPEPKDWKALAEEYMEQYHTAYTTDQPRRVVMARRNYEVEEWESVEKVTTTTKTD